MQISSPQPIYKEGVRVVDCPFYSDCLMYAAKRNWKDLTCDECPNLRLNLIGQKLKFIAPYYELFSEIYLEFRRKYEPAMKSISLET